MDKVKPWRTVNVIPLSGIWCNRYRQANGKVIHDPCPGLLIQERGGETRTVFATFENGILFPACETAGFEESSSAGGPRSNPYRPGLPPWKLLDERDPEQKVADDIAAGGDPLAKSYVGTVW